MPYIVDIYSHSSAGPTTLEAPTITAARKEAESYGSLADKAIIKTKSGKVVAQHRRDQSGNGLNWFRAEI